MVTQSRGAFASLGRGASSGGVPRPGVVWGTRLLVTLAVVFSGPVARADVYDDCTEEYDAPIAYWSFEPDELSGGAYRDQIGARPAYVEGAPAPVGGIVGDALSLDGVDDYLRVGSSFPEITRSFTISAWVYRRELPAANQSIVDKWDHENGKRSFRLGDTSGYMTAEVSADGTYETNRISAMDHEQGGQLNQWSHWVAAYDGTEVRLYRDGVVVGLASFGKEYDVFASTVEVWIGRARGTGDRFVSGDLDEIAIWNQALTPDQVFALFERGVARLPAYDDLGCTDDRLGVGGHHACLRQSNDSLRCWGRNDYGQATPPTGAFAQVDGGIYHTCGLRFDHTVQCWGRNAYGEAAPPAERFASISSGRYHNCGITEDRRVECWGYDYYGQSSPPAGSFRQVSAGAYHTCGLRFDDTVECWGYAGYGALDAPVGAFVELSSGAYYTCGLRYDGSSECWGYNYYGQSSPPVGYFFDVNAGGYHACGLRLDGSIDCWGYNGYGQTNASVGSFVEVDNGLYNGCAISDEGVVQCWGYGGYNLTSPPGELTGC